MVRLIPLLSMLVLTACITQAQVSREVAKPNHRGELIDNKTVEWFRYTTAPYFTLPSWGGLLQAAYEIAWLANKRGQTLVVTEKMQSAGVAVALLVDRIEVANPNAPWFGLHYTSVSDNWRGNASSGYRITVSREATLIRYRTLGIMGCLAWYDKQPEARINKPIYVSWNFLKSNCKE